MCVGYVVNNLAARPAAGAVGQLQPLAAYAPGYCRKLGRKFGNLLNVSGALCSAERDRGQLRPTDGEAQDVGVVLNRNVSGTGRGLTGATALGVRYRFGY